MSGIPITVKASGAPTKLGAAPLSPGTSIYNTDSNNGIWVADIPGVRPNFGQYIGPLGTGKWGTSNSLVYACVDAGVNADVTIVVSSDFQDVTNPLLIAEATAAQIASSGLAASIGVQVAQQVLANGVPQVLNQVLLASYPGIFTLASGASATINNPGAYATLVVQINSSTNPGVLRLQFDENTPFSNLDYSYQEWLTNPDTTGNAPATWAVPVNYQSVQITNAGASAINLIVYGSNRMVYNSITQLGETAMTRKLSFNGAMTNGIVVTLGTGDANSRITTRFNRSVFIRAAVSGGAQGLVGYQYIQQNGAVVQSYVASLAAGANSFLTVGHPALPVSWVILPSATTASGGISVDVTAQSL